MEMEMSCQDWAHGIDLFRHHLVQQNVHVCVSVCVCRYFANEPFADLHRVEGLHGVFVATLINGSLREENMRSVITFDKGGTWELLQPPTSDSLGGSIDCQVEQT